MKTKKEMLVNLDRIRIEVCEELDKIEKEITCLYESPLATRNKVLYSSLNEKARKLETEIDCLIFASKKDSYQKPTEKQLSKFDIDSIYTDQAINHGPLVGSAWLPMGLKKMDHFYATEICDSNSKYTVEELEFLIKRNPHLHNIIKHNLLTNLENRNKNLVSNY
jgi:hypothetical protein